MAAKAGHTNVVRRLTEAGANPNAVVPGDETPLINAARAGHLDIVEFLVEHGADVSLAVTANATQVRTPLNQASDTAIRSYLVSRGAKE
ncbi:Regulatory sensor-transducer, BlaR1/MecR1 family [Lysobacter sp. A03]|nr:Regulatory sensor-transducer, BlaR1/MecR1 family [Lysobacter sp. A03]